MKFFRPYRLTTIMLMLILSYAIVMWFLDSFGSIPLDQVLSHLMFGIEGVADVDAATKIDAVRLISYRFMLIGSFYFLIKYLIQRGAQHYIDAYPRITKACISLLLLSASAYIVYLTDQALQLSQSWSNKNTVDYFDTAYVKPSTRSIDFESDDKPNLLFIYLESMENAYRNQAVFGHDLLEALDSKHTQGQSFARYIQTPETSWTIGAIVATQCGVPLRAFGALPQKSDGTEHIQFMQDATCLGDVLAARGYTNVHLQGASAFFTRKDQFFGKHGGHTVLALEHWKTIHPEEDFHDWGLSDTRLLDEGLKQLRTLHAAKQPFNMSLLTVITHRPNGFLSPNERQSGCPAQLQDIAQCSSKQIAQFIAHAKQEGLLDHTVVVVVGDHLLIPAEPSITALINKTGERTIFNQFILPNNQRIKEAYLGRTITHFDFYPSILSLLGAKIDGDRLGLGYNFFADDFRSDEELQHLSKDLGVGTSDKYLDLWLNNKDSDA